MIRVILTDNGWQWEMIGFDGRVLVYNTDAFPTDFAAFEAGKAYRSAFWASASRIDHRMGACI